tara:strand:+ start:17193 stop:18755 length:1563 start_codon:yes stop_codon:yes gene_type:complete
MNPFTQHLDVCIIGGGINGAGLALDATLRGLRVGLFEQFDFGFGASTATSKLAHGGLRYLESRQFNLVKESLNERNFLLNKAPHLVKPLQFYVPLYKHSKWKPWELKIGLKLYDWMQTQRSLPAHHMVQKHQLATDVPWLNKSDLVACGSYFDAQMADHRLIMELLLMAHNEGAEIHNYTKASNIQETSSGLGIDLHREDKYIGSVNANSVILATGAWNNQWSDGSLVKPTKGIHIVLPDMDLSVALLLMAPKDDRVFFMMPWEGKTLVGTTDQQDDLQYSLPRVSQEDVQYLLDAVNAYHTKRTWALNDVSGVFCGYRPLIQTNEKSPSKQSREESYVWLNHHMLSVSGGKYTTYRSMAERAINLIQNKVFFDRVLTKSNTSMLGFMGAFDMPDWPSETQLTQLSDRYRLSRESLVHLIETYGMLYKDVLNTISYHPESSIRFDIELPIILAELKYAVSKEWVRELDDFLLRRTYYGVMHYDQPDFLRSVATQFKQMTASPLSEEQLLKPLHDRLGING